ncbi:autophagy-related protein 17 [Monosporozyma servazzii]
MDPSEVKGYLDNATRHLIEAQSVCYECSLKIQTQTKDLSQWQAQVNKINFIGDCIAKQCQFLYDNILHVGIEENLIAKQWGDDTMTQLTDEMRLWQEKIDNQIKTLKDTPNLLASTGITTEGEKKFSLADYISQDNVDLLKNKIQEIPSIEKHINNIRNQYNELNKKVKDKLINNRLKDLQTLIKNEFSMRSSDLITLVEIYPKDLIEAENDLGSILISLTTHFDRCKLLVRNTGLDKNNMSQEISYQINNDSQLKNSLSKIDYIGLYKIVKKDNDELPSILATIYEIIDDIESVLTKSGRLLDQKRTMNITIKGKITKFLDALTKYNEYLTIFEDISTLISNFKESCQKDIETIKELYEFYEQFQDSYKNLLKESQRRESVAMMMENILQDCEKKLKSLGIDDLNQRQHFLEENGNYLPGNIWPDEIDDFTPLYSMNYSVKRF